MKLISLFKGLIILQVLTLVLTMIFTPEDPIYYEQAIGMLDYFLMIYFLLWFVSLFLLYRFKSIGRSLFTMIVIIGFPLAASVPDYFAPNGALIDTLIWLGGALDGAMLVLLYLTNIKEKFQQ